VRQAAIVYGLILAVLVAALVMSYLGYRQYIEVGRTAQAKDFEKAREIGVEKVIGLQDNIVGADLAMFDAIAQVDPANLSRRLPDLLENSTLQSVMVLDADRKVMAGGFYTKRLDDPTTREVDETEAFKQLFEGEVLGDLGLDQVGLGERRHLHRSYDGLPYLFACTRRFVDGQLVYLVVEADIGYLIAAMFPRFFDVKSNYLYQVVDERGELVYGYRFTTPEHAEVPLGDTLSGWRLRVAPRDPLPAPRRTGLVQIGLALVVIVAALGVVVLAVRRERRVSQLKSEFISNVSHELKTPLSIISMFGELLAMGRVKSPEQGREYADIIRRESVRLSRLIDSVLDFSKIERGVDVYEFAAEQDLREVVERALEISRHRLDRAGMALETELGTDLPPVTMDGNAMTLAVLNLVDNALKYAADGKALRVALRHVGDRVELEVADRGPGVPQDEWDAVFERFYRSRTVRLKPIRGSGIGLALVKHIAEAHGGDVSVEAGEAGRGARFRLWIPAPSRA
jgi:two-component system, OmpR family, phosphate regulon sensor histidine kinase PhoR